ncbi:MAG: hypothetical protein FWB74_09040 [Defluviitaleaceae bacterium]|nr:hypothetical protein [Defluviitaleaceae bacterium]
MKRYDAIEAVKNAISAEGLADALFLKGSIAKGTDDDWSDVDFYAAVSPENFDAFLARRIHYIEAYKPLIYWSNVNHVGPQIVGVFEDGLHFDLYTVPTGAIPQTGEIKPLYDPAGILASYSTAPLSVTSEEIIRAIHSFTFVLVEFEAAFHRGDTIWATRLSHALLGELSIVLRHLHDPQNAQLGLKGIHKVIPKDMTEILKNSMDVPALIKLMSELIKQLPTEVRKRINMKFFEFMATSINLL